MNAIPPVPTIDEELFAFVRDHLFSAVIGDVLDTLDLLHQFLPPDIQPLSADMVLVGRAMPVVEELLPEDGAPIKPFGLMFRALDDLKPGEIYMCNNPGVEFALWGELMSLRAGQLGAAGAIVDGYSRDTRGILKQGFPTFSRGRYAQDQRARGHVTDFRHPIRYRNGTTVSPGDLVFGDIDGVVVVPREVEREAIHMAIQKVFGENTVRTAIEGGLSTQDAFGRYDIM